MGFSNNELRRLNDESLRAIYRESIEEMRVNRENIERLHRQIDAAQDAFDEAQSTANAVAPHILERLGRS